MTCDHQPAKRLEAFLNGMVRICAFVFPPRILRNHRHSSYTLQLGHTESCEYRRLTFCGCVNESCLNVNARHQPHIGESEEADGDLRDAG